jgi:hypothetical protein
MRTLAQLQQRYYLLAPGDKSAWQLRWAPPWLRVRRQQCRGVSEVQQAAFCERSKSHCSTQQQWHAPELPLCVPAGCLCLVCGGAPPATHGAREPRPFR